MLTNAKTRRIIDSRQQGRPAKLKGEITMLKSEQKKLERAGFKINYPNKHGKFEYWIESNMSNRYFTVRIFDTSDKKWQTLCTRANLDTALAKATEHINA